MIYCNKCGKENIDSFRFCTGCGNSFSNPMDIPSQTQTQYPIQKRHKNQFLILGLVGLFGIFAGGIGGYYLSNKNGSGSKGNELTMVQDTLEKTNSSDTKLEVNTPVITSTTDQASVKPLSSLKENDQSGTYKKDDELEDKSLRNGENAGASIMLDKMNVFYIGVPNPITISSWTEWDKTSVSIIGGTISGTGPNRVVTVNEVGAASIIVAAEGKSTKFNFRVKRIPDPIIRIGPTGGGKIQAVVFRSQQFVRTELENFDFEAKFNVNGATVYFTNPGDRNVKMVSLSSGSLGPASEYMQTLVPGSTVIFDNIRVVGPDGQPRTIQNPPGFSLF